MLGRTLRSVSYQAKLDASIKKILANKSILAFILKYTVEEFADLERSEIEDLIEQPVVSSIPIEPGITNELITGMPQEIKEPGEGITTYDIRFFARSLKGNSRVEYTLIINVEAQSGSKKTYDYETRGIVYCSRMISEQVGRNITHNHYERVQKVYSIWIIMNDTQKAANTISECGIYNRTLEGDYDHHPRYDLMKVVIIRLPKDGEEKKAVNPANRLTSMLTTLLSERISPEEKMGSLKDDFNIPVTEEISEEANDMCNYSDWLLQNKAEEFAVRMLKKEKYSDEEIADNAGISLERVKELKQELKDNPVMA